MRVEHSEVADDDRDGQSDGQYSHQRTNCSDYHTNVRLGRHVSIANGCHSNNGPPESIGYADEVIGGIVLQTFGIEYQRSKEDDEEHEEEDEKN